MFLILASTIWLSFLTAKGEISIRQDTVTTIVAQKSTTNCKSETKDGKNITTCPIEYYICTGQTCQGILWEKSFEELKKVVIPNEEVKIQN